MTRHFYTKALLLLLCAFGTMTGRAQSVNTYGFAASSGTYTPITGGTLLTNTTAAYDDATFTPIITMPFTFTYHGAAFTTVSIQQNGFIRLGAAASSSYSPLSAGVTNTISAMGADLYSAAATTGREVRYQTIGTTPNQQFVVQFANWGFYNGFVNAGFNDFSYQIILSETTNTVQIVYGNCPDNSGASQNVQVGLTGAPATNYQVLSTTTSWATPIVSTTSNSGTMAFNTTVKPTSGQTYTWTPPVISPCAGTPPTPVASGPALACSGQAFTLTASNLVVAGTTGITYQWESSPSGAGTYTPITGATTSTYSATQTAATDYHLVVTCTNGGGQSVSNVVSVGMNTYLNCYCTPSHLYGCSFYATLNTVSFNTLTHSPGCSASPYYTNVPTATATTTVVPTSTYTLTINSGGYDIAGAWIDWNQDGTFATTEYYALGTTNSGSTATNKSATITVPSGAVIGTTKVRIRTEYYGYTLTSANACTQLNYGETVDYTITVAAGVPCSGTPPATVAMASATTVCPTTPFTLSATGIPATGTGFTYQWQYSVAGGAFTSLAGATTNPYTGATLQGGTTTYQLVVTCAASATSTTSSSVTVNQTSFLSCYCSSQATNTADEEILNVTVGTLNNTSNCTTIAPGPGSILEEYSNFTSGTGAPAAPDLAQGLSVPFSIQQGTCGGIYSNGIAIFIDYNHNGSFTDPGEMVANNGTATIATPYFFTGNFTVPATALLGNTVMRVINVEGTAGASITPCLSYGYGETEDYLVNIIVATPCAGPPPTAVASAPASVCSGVTFNITATNLVPAGTSGITYQLQSAPAGTTTFAAVGTASNNPSFTVSQTAATDYRIIVTCANGNATSTSNTVSVGMNSFIACYCTPTHTYGCLSGTTPYGTITAVSFSTLNETGLSCPASPYYVNVSPGAATTTVVPTGTYTLSVTSGYYDYAGAWIDWNQDGVFDAATEYVALGTSNSTAANITRTATVTVPAGAVLGNTKMRIRTEAYFYTFGSGSACGNLYYGETRDYTITVATGVACAGAPPATNVTASVATTCPANSFTLTATGIPLGTTGLTFQWQSSPAGQNNFNDIVGATTNPYNGALLLNAAATDYQVIVTCTNGAQSSTSNIVTVSPSNFMNCYCTSFSQTTADEEITNVTVGTLNQSSTCSTTGTGPASIAQEYSDYTTGTGAPTAPDLAQASTVAFSIDEGTCGSFNYSNGIAIFIDYNHNGSFTDPGEMVANNGTTTITSPYTFAGSFTVPPNALLGNTRMRVVNVEGTAGASITPCMTYYYGETEDYLVNIIAGTPCSGTPPTAVASGPTTACPSQAFTITGTNLVANGTTGITYQLQSRPTGVGTYALIGTAQNTPTFSVTQTVASDYQIVVVCANGNGTSTSNTVTVALSGYISCYCTPSHLYGCGTYGTINTVSFNTLANSPGCSASPYYTNSASTITTSVVPSSTYTLTINSGGYDIAGAWIDWNEDGTFSSSEYYALGVTNNNSTATNKSATVTVPAGAVLGNTKVRIRTEAYFYTLAATDACTTLNYGQTVDYTISVIAGTPCAGTPATTVASASVTAVCPTVPFTLSATGIPAGTTGLTYQWQYSVGGSAYASLAGATTNPYTAATTQGGTTSYRLVVTCTASAASSTSNVVTVTQNGVTGCYCSPLNGTTLHSFVNDLTTNVTISGTTLNSSNGTDATTGYLQIAPTPSSNTATLSPGTTYTASLTFSSTPTQVSIWVDYNQNGVFEASEYSNGTISGTTGSITLAVPAGATQGTTGLRMRVRNANYTSSDACLTFGSGETEDYTVTIGAPAACASPTAVSVTGITQNSASVGWTCTSCTGTFVVEYGLAGFTPGTGATAGTGGTVITSATNPQSLGTALTAGSNYTVFVRQNCGGSSYSSNSSANFSTLLANDNAPGAIALTLGAGCTGSPYTNVGATQATGEPAPYCAGSTTGNHTVWFKFVAPASGAVRVSTDAGTGQTINDSRIAVFSTTNVNTYSTFNILGCDDDNGVVGSALSIVYLTGLTSGTTYYVEVDGYGATDVGTFCITADAIDNTMVATTAACVGGQSNSSANSYQGWTSLVDNSAKLIANVRVPGSTGSNSFTPSVNINTTGTRNAVFNGVNQKYLDRSYTINSTATNTNVQLFFLNSELTSLQTTDPLTTLAKLDVTEQSNASGTCQPSYVATNGTNTLLFQTGNGASGTVRWVNVTAPGFSNFYLHRSSAAVSAVVGLYGDMQTNGTMRNDLQAYFTPTTGLLPTTDPYGLGATDASINSTTGVAGTVVDWVRLEARNATSATTLATPVESHAVLLKPNGTIVDPVTGAAPLFDAHAYPVRLVVIHRNHLAIMSNNITSFLDATPYNFTTALSQAANDFGDPAQMVMKGGKWCMWAGDVNQDLGIDGTDAGQVSSAVNAGAFDVYSVTDLNMDGGLDGTDSGIISFSNNTAPFSTLVNY